MKNQNFFLVIAMSYEFLLPMLTCLFSFNCLIPTTCITWEIIQVPLKV